MSESTIAEIKAGDVAQFRLSGKDAKGNTVDYKLLTQQSSIRIEPTDSEDYSYTLGSDKDSVIISVVINKLGNYKLTYFINDKEFKPSRTINEINVIPGKCSAMYPDVRYADASIYTGDTYELIVHCRDQYNNLILQQGDELFSYSIKGTNLEVVNEDDIPYKETFNNGEYRVTFVAVLQGDYTIKINLNGMSYYKTIEFSVLPLRCPYQLPIMCSNRKCVEEVIQCTNDIDTFNCKDPAMPFYCKVRNLWPCVSSLSDCDCQDGYKRCKGMCLPENMPNFCDNPIKNTCSRKLSKSLTVDTCQDGSCRTFSACPNPQACPVGYKSCINSCVKATEDCNNYLPPKCDENDVLCWDLSCANSIDLCPTGKTCNNPLSVVCPDGKCVTHESECPQPPLCVQPFSYLCPDFTCKKSKSDCLGKPVCMVGQALCEDNKCREDCSKNNLTCAHNMYLCPTGGLCVPNNLLCPTPVTCPKDFIKCPSGGCAKQFDQCNFQRTLSRISCPLETPILCADLSCVSDMNECSPVIQCPKNLPILCQNNECRAKKEECPTPITCPDKYPVLCPDNSCQKTSYHCPIHKHEPNEVICKIRCSDGSCASSPLLCPTNITCPKDLYKCWDSSCVKDINECIEPKVVPCPNPLFPYRCNDGSCRTDKLSCSTVAVCPRDRPVKCYDGSCRASIEICPQYKPCGKNMKSCPDGTCTFDKCNTEVTCPIVTPFLCPDNTCKIDSRDCRGQQECLGGFICPDGSCVSNRQNCKYFETCSIDNPVKCAHGACAASIDECNSIISECPSGYVKCRTGGCKINQSMCEKFTCPSNLPILCPEGQCVYDRKHCDDSRTGCPFTKPYKCFDGTCVDNLNRCAILNNNATCEKGSYHCDDGSCRKDPKDCPKANGCPTNKPVKCADGICIDPSLTSCNNPTCPSNRPIKCLNGDCVDTTSSCSNVTELQDYYDCSTVGKEGYFMCADGNCVPTPEMCKPLFECPRGYIKCSDSTCKITSNLCPKTNNCPSVRAVRCPNGKCVAEAHECFTNTICTTRHPIKCDNGECVDNANNCKPVAMVNGCPSDKPFKCLDGRCLEDEDQCFDIHLSCTKELPVLCPDGSCNANAKDCKTKRDFCPEGMILCPDSKCVDFANYKNNCLNKHGCPLIKPYRCADGSCSEDDRSCPLSISCPSHMPILCADKSCSFDAKFCNVQYPCTSPKPFICPNGFCIENDSLCKNYSDYCPLTSPIKCSSGRCVSTLQDCSLEYYTTLCKPDQIFCTPLSECVNSMSECIGASNVSGYKASEITRRLQTAPVTPDNNCPTDKPFSCSDGTCAGSAGECKPVKACNAMEFRCPSGQCATDPKLCVKSNIQCDNDLILCEDGLCRKTCPQFNGCSITKPYQCSNGQCVKNKLDCIGQSLCEDINAPFRCIDGTCVSDTSKCPLIKRLSMVDTFAISASKLNTIEADFAFDAYKRPIGKVTIPANTLYSQKEQYLKIEVTQVAHSYLARNVTYNNTDILLFDVANGIPASQGILTFENSVLSTILHIEASSPEFTFQHPARLMLEHNYYNGGKFLPSDYCLAILTTLEGQTTWHCVDRKKKDSQTIFQFSQFGTYAVVLNPSRVYIYEVNSYSFFFDHLKIILIVLGSVFSGIIVLYYIFSRVVRYREKYFEHKEKIIVLQNQLEEYKNMTIDMPGQTLADNIAGIQFTKNPAHSASSIPKSSHSELENEIENIQRKCKVIDSQNKNLEMKIHEAQGLFKHLKYEIDNLKQ
jgi:hypothetical protein